MAERAVVALGPRRTSGTANLTQFGRDEFLAEYWDYEPGQHVTLLGPTNAGKTTLAYQLLGETTHEKLPGVVLVMKPRDKTVEKWNKELGYRKVRAWPPAPSIWQPRRPPGYTVWPKHTFNPDIDDERLYSVFRSTILDSYRRGDRVIFADELLGLTNDLNLKTEVRAVLTRGRSMGVGFWTSSQRPFDVPLYAYNQASHLFLHNDPDTRSTDRYGEIGGVDPKMVSSVARGLGQHQWLYIRRNGPVMAVVDA